MDVFLFDKTKLTTITIGLDRANSLDHMVTLVTAQPWMALVSSYDKAVVNMTTCK